MRIAAYISVEQMRFVLLYKPKLIDRVIMIVFNIYNILLSSFFKKFRLVNRNR